jgi:hypothetical protein
MKKYLAILIGAIIICWLSWFYVLFTVDPFKGGIVGHSLFYTSLFLSFSGTFHLIILGIRYKFMPNELPTIRIKTSWRQALFLTLTFVLSLYLASRNMLKWWNSLLLIIAVVILEIILQAEKRLSFSRNQNVFTKSRLPGEIVDNNLNIQNKVQSNDLNKSRHL